jgi:hypothetical protein
MTIDPGTYQPMPVTCTTTSCGLSCIRKLNHGALHLDPHGDWWILQPHGPDEPALKPMSGYRILHDELLVEQTMPIAANCLIPPNVH